LSREAPKTQLAETACGFVEAGGSTSPYLPEMPQTDKKTPSLAPTEGWMALHDLRRRT
jgi:hypothetical protein